jgi:predicted Rossmann fold nucleotide-binding protein DprA/Smf involved in DNA uptake
MRIGSFDAKKRTEVLVELRKQHEPSAKKAQELLKSQQTDRKKLLQAMKAGPSSVPQLTSATGIPTHEVLWHVAAMKKYGLVEEAGMDDADEYYLYRLTKEARA